MNNDFFDLPNQVAIVTGAASGIGRAAAERFAKAGAKVVAADMSEKVNDTVGMISDGGGEAIAVTMDAGKEEDVKALVEKAVVQYGGLDIFFANAGIGGDVPGGLFDTDSHGWAEMLRVNLIGPYLAVKYAAEPMKTRGGGSIVCTASVAGLRSGAGPASYSASKAGVINLVQTAAQQLSGTNVRVNAICPGLIKTAMTQPIYEYAKEQNVLDKIGHLNPLRRDADPDEIASVAQFLSSKAASYVNGTAVVVDGGLSSSHPFGKV